MWQKFLTDARFHEGLLEMDRQIAAEARERKTPPFSAIARIEAGTLLVREAWQTLAAAGGWGGWRQVPYADEGGRPPTLVQALLGERG